MQRYRLFLKLFASSRRPNIEVTRQTKRWLFGSAALLLLAGCAVLFRSRTIYDYASGAEGIVLDSSGNPVPDARVTIYFEETVYEAITPVDKVELTSGADGRFAESFISCGKPGGRYRISVTKPGYDLAVVSGEGHGSHRIILLPAKAQQRRGTEISSQPLISKASAGLGLPPEFAAYRDWVALLKEPEQVPIELWSRCMAPTTKDWQGARLKYGPHSERLIQVYQRTPESSEESQAPFPIGTVMAKEKLSGAPDMPAEGVAFMVKREGWKFPESDGWEFLFFPSGRDKRETHEECAACHRVARATDYVFGEYPR